MTADYSTRRKFTNILFVVLCAAAVVRFVVVVSLPIMFLPGAGHDDGLYMRLAANLVAGHWLGEFNQYTLMKGPGYPAFLALSSLSGLPVSATHALLQSAAILAAAWSIYRVTASRTFAVLTFTTLTFYPIGFMPELLRVVRDQIYWAQTLLLFSFLAVAFLAPPRGFLGNLVVAGLAGLTLGWAWLTREEGIWLVPGLGVLTAGAALIYRRQRHELLALTRSIAVAAIGFIAVNVAFMTGNRLVYGSFVGVDFKEHNFEATLEALQDVENGPIIPFVPVPNTTRSEVAKISPAFAPVSAALAPGQPVFETWSRGSCGVDKTACGEVIGAVFMWALRDAAAASDFYRSPATATENFGKVASQIAMACRDGRLRCRRRWVGFMPPLAARQWASLPGAARAVIQKVVFRDPPMPTTAAPFVASRDGRYWEFLNDPYIGSRIQNGYDLTVRGWYRDVQSADWPAFKVYANNGQEISSTVARLSSPDLQQHFSDPSAGNNRYETSFHCPNICTIVATSSHDREIRIALDADQPMSAASGSAVLYVDSAFSAEAAGLVNPAQKAAMHIRTSLVWLFKFLIPALIVIGLAAAIVATWLSVRRRTLNAALVMAFAAWTLVATRIAILALIEISSFGAANFLYAAPATYLAVVAAFLSIAAICGRSQSART